MRRKLVLALMLSGVTAIVFAQPPGQDKSQLEKERQQIQKELQEIQSAYNKVKGQSKQILTQVNVLNRKIDLQEKYIGSINKEIRSIEDDIYLSELEIYRLNKQLDTLKSEYARSVVYAYKNRSNYDYLNFIFSANSFNDAIKRISYLKSYRAYREKQVETIKETQQLISQRKDQQLKRKDQKNVALSNQTTQVKELESQKKEKDVVMSQLKSKEKDLAKQIAAKKKKDRDLQNAIAAIVKREIKAAEAKAKAEAEAKRKADELAKKNGATTNAATTPSVTTPTTTSVTKRNVKSDAPASYLDLNAKDVALNANFQANKAKLPWPVDNGIVTLRFGKNKVGDYIDIDNPGLTIATPSAGVTVKAVFDGEVSAVMNLGDGMAVMVRHGKYFTIYSNLSSVSVTKGTTVKTGHILGKAGKDDDGNGGSIEFVLMNETRNIDPYPWLRR